MKRILKTTLIILIVASYSCKKQEKHFISDEIYRAQVVEQFEKQKKKANNRANKLFAVLNSDISLEKKEALQFLFAYMPLSDLADYDGEFFLQNVEVALMTKDTFSWGKTIPENIFRHFVLPYRINNENLDTARIVFFNELKERIKHLSMKEAALEVNHWCHEKVSYKGSDMRTSAPLSTVCTSWGRCGEESTFTVTAMRAAGIPARQCYTPRWAHCDDNHAWVEVWVDNKWYFLGACEPEADLNIGWFAGPALRAMLVNTNVFGKYDGPEEIILKEELYTRINLLANYAPTKTIYVQTISGKDSKPLANAKVDFGLYNYAEFYSIASKMSNDDGIASLLTGFGDLMIWCSFDNKFAYKKITIEETDTVLIILEETPVLSKVEQFDLTPPIKKVPKSVSTKGKEENARKLKEEDKIRTAYMETFIDSAQAYEFAKSVNINPEKTWHFLDLSEGNWKEILEFIKSKENKELIIPLLANISKKDLRDTKAEILIDHLLFSGEQKVKDDIFFKYILSPRINFELITQYKSFFQNEFKNNEFLNPNNIINWVKQNIKIDEKSNYYRVSITPMGVYNLRITNSLSRDIFFVAVCRSKGIAARLEPATRIPQYFSNGRWINASFEKTVKSNSPKGFLIINNSDENPIQTPEYYIHYTIGKLEKSVYKTLDYEFSDLVKTFPVTLDLEVGSYRIVSGNRIDQGKVLCEISYFDVEGGKTTEFELKLREDSQTAKALFQHKFDDLKLPIANNLTEKISLLGSAENASLLLWLEPDKEPTKHIIKDISKLKNKFQTQGCQIVNIITNEKDTEMAKGLLGEAFDAPTICLDKNSQLLNEISAMLETNVTRSYPVVILLNKKSQIIFLSEGYTIGIGEQIVRKIGDFE